jgi:D-psicose/D-tagatose/L-ribulose 3-epimerase
MNQLGVHALVWTGGWSESEAALAIAETKRAGYDLIEIPLLDPASVDAAMTRRLLDEHGLSATCSLGLSAATDISSEDKDAVAAGEALLRQALKCAVDFRSPYMGGILYSAFQKYMRPPTQAGRANAIAVLKRLAREAAADGVTLGLEVVNRYETNLLNTADEALAFIAEVDEPNVGVHLDTYHMNIEEDDMFGPVRRCGDKLVYVHIGESHRGYLGSGSVDFSTFFKALAAQGYAGTITFESFSSAIVSPTLSNILGVWRNLWTDGYDLAVRAHAFMTAHLRD